MEDFEIIVVDNNSEDGSIEIFKEEFSNKIKLISNKTNIGFGPANNSGAKYAGGEYLFFLNSDTLLKENILGVLKKYLDENKNVGILSPKLLLENGEGQTYAFGKFPTIIGAVRNKLKQPLAYTNKPMFIDWVSGAAMIVRKEIFNQINGFDKKYFMYFEDIDICRRVKNIGYEVVVFPKVSIIHLCGKSINEFVKRKYYYYQSQDYYFKKHYGKAKLLIMRIIRWPYRIISLIIN